MSSSRPPSIQRTIVVGLVMTATSLCVSILIAAILRVASPVVAVGNRVIDRTPLAVKDWAVEFFNGHHKAALEIGTVIILTMIAIVVARFAQSKPSVGIWAIAIMSIIGIAASNSDVDGQLALVPAVLGGIAGAMALLVLVGAVAARRSEDSAAKDQSPSTEHSGAAAQAPDQQLPVPMPTSLRLKPLDRRDFIAKASMISAAAATLGAVGAGIERSTSADVAQLAQGLPKPRAPFGDIPTTATVPEGIEPFLTRNDKFYRIDTALRIPRVDLTSWKLKVGGMVDRPLELSYDDLMSLEVIERPITLCCVSNEVGGEYVGNAMWLGVRLADVLDQAGVQQGATQLASKSADGWTCGFPTEAARDGRDAMIAVGMNGEPLPIPHGFPARLVIPGLYGYVSATKWLTEITLTTLEDFDGYWIPRGWSKIAPIKTQSRIDVPRDSATVNAGSVAFAGVAWAQHRGVTAVEVSIDSGEWQNARLGDSVSTDAWRQWVLEWQATPGSHEIRVRATDSTGTPQTADVAEPAPSGATGYHTIRVDVS